jgi:SAM-dependent methyltransferase
MRHRRAIAWCQQELQPATFTTVDPWARTPYESSGFDLVIGYSVFTHLAKGAQTAWLEEMKRIIRPGGLFLASTHGDFAASFLDAASLAALAQTGISDDALDRGLDGLAPEGYYRMVYQTRGYTIEEWSKHLEVLEYIERGVGNLQDLIVMRRRCEE